MQTNFSEEQLKDPHVKASEKILRTCVHCGFCTATCPTYVLLGDELDSPRGRIYLIKDMLENGRPASDKEVKHIDRCLSCLSCMTTCPSGVHYMHLVDHARKHIEDTYQRPLPERFLRWVLALVLPYPSRFRWALIGAWLVRALAPLMPPRWRAMLKLAPARGPAPPHPLDLPQSLPARGEAKARVALLTGCAQQILEPEINDATVRLLTRHGVEVVVAKGMGCCGALVHHMGKEAQALVQAKANIDAWWREIDGAGLDAVVINASGCGTTVKDYGFMLRDDPEYSEKARIISAMTKDVTELLADLALDHRRPSDDMPVVAYHSACSMQHGQKITELPKRLLVEAGFAVKSPAEGHLCCGSAGTYNIMQPAIADRLKERKVSNIERLKPDVIATGNIGCITQIGSGTDIPVVHTVQLLDWATGGPKPDNLPA